MFGRSPRRQAVEETRAAAADSLATTTADLRALLDEVSAAALTVYALHGLPCAPGHYRQPPGTADWEHLGDALSAEEKWALLDRGPAGQGWRYASLEQIGARAVVADVRYASGLLSACQGLRQRLKDGTPLSPQDLADAVRLGATWRRLTDAVQTRSDLRFQAPDEG